MFAALDADGNLIATEATIDQAIAAAGNAGWQAVMLEDRLPPEDPGFGYADELGAPAPDRMPSLALKASGLPELRMSEVMRMNVREAYTRLVKHFPKTRMRQGERVTVNYGTPSILARRLLGQNYKTSKPTPEDPSDVQGLSLVPHQLIRELAPDVTRMRTFCTGASLACKKACLVYSGQNGADPYNLVIKVGRTKALLHEPVAFVRMLVEAIAFHVRTAPAKSWEIHDGGGRRVRHGTGVVPFFRLNVFSDIPWELVAPELFKLQYEGPKGSLDFRKVRFYDYTKVAGRQPPENYDLTFSYSGTNKKLVDFEIERRRRIAVVFLLPGGLVARRAAPLPRRFWGLDVIDGDVSDVRPRDAAPSVVGLRWKVPNGHKIGQEQMHSAFVVPCSEVEGVLVAGVAARQEPMHDADDEEETDDVED